MGSGRTSTHSHAQTPHNNHSHKYNRFLVRLSDKLGQREVDPPLSPWPYPITVKSTVRAARRSAVMTFPQAKPLYFFRKRKIVASLVLALSKSSSLFTAPAEDSLKNKCHI